MHILTRCYFHLGLESERQQWGPWTSIMETESEQNSNSTNGVLALGNSRPQIAQMSLYERQAVQVRLSTEGLWALAWGVQRCRKIITLETFQQTGPEYDQVMTKVPCRSWEPLEFTTVWASRQTRYQSLRFLYHSVHVARFSLTISLQVVRFLFLGLSWKSPWVVEVKNLNYFGSWKEKKKCSFGFEVNAKTELLILSL